MMSWSAETVERSSLVWVIYLACLTLVFSFILFEVLDVDGSDFPVPLSRAVSVIKTTEPPHDIKRAFGGPAVHGWYDLALCIVRSESDRLPRSAEWRASAVTIAIPRWYRAALPRGSLLESPPSA